MPSPGSIPNPLPDDVPRWRYDPPASGPAVVHEDTWTGEDGHRRGFVVVDKPAGLLSVPGIGPEKADCARSRVADSYPWATGPMTVHRLDVATSGVLFVALDPDTQRNLSVQIERRRVTKRYEALVIGHATGEGVVSVPLRKDLERRPTQLVDFEQGKASETRWRAVGVERAGGVVVTRVGLEPITGRTHQLRVHMSDSAGTEFVRTVGEPGPEHIRGLGMPILGDELYGGGSDTRLMLHARTLTFNHPATGKMLSVRTDVPF